MFDWRGTLVTTLTEHEWVTRALDAVGMSSSAAGEVLQAIELANGPSDRLDAPGVDSDAAAHRKAFMDVFADAQLPGDLADALYDLDGDHAHNPFAHDVHDTLHALREAGMRLAVVSDIHFDLRPAFAAAGLLEVVDVFTLSFEQGIQKPNPLMFTRTASALGVEPAACLRWVTGPARTVPQSSRASPLCCCRPFGTLRIGDSTGSWRSATSRRTPDRCRCSA